ncbi:MAG: hypothetical protein DYG89_17185 [Caldilinea sp. CFX5]|nr:hypothetical protein [Caldilinea sp. CFX5]
MDDLELKQLQAAIQRAWSHPPSDKVARYIDKFFECQRIGSRISGRVEGNHGIYRVSIRATNEGVDSACSCYIGKGGYCHHCAAMAITFLRNPAAFPAIERKERKDVQSLSDLGQYLAHTTLASLLEQIKAQGISVSDFAQAIGSNTQRLTAMKKGEQSNRVNRELGAVKLACLWVMEHKDEFVRKKK